MLMAAIGDDNEDVQEHSDTDNSDSESSDDDSEKPKFIIIQWNQCIATIRWLITGYYYVSYTVIYTQCISHNNLLECECPIIFRIAYYMKVDEESQVERSGKNVLYKGMPKGNWYIGNTRRPTK